MSPLMSASCCRAHDEVWIFHDLLGDITHHREAVLCVVAAARRREKSTPGTTKPRCVLECRDGESSWVSMSLTPICSRHLRRPYRLKNEFMGGCGWPRTREQAGSRQQDKNEDNRFLFFHTLMSALFKVPPAETSQSILQNVDVDFKKI